MKPGTSALTAITSHAFLKALQQQVSEAEIQSAVSNLAAEISSKLGEGKNVALGILVTGEGIALKEIASDENSTEVVGLVVTDDAVVAGAAVITKDEVDYEIGVATAEGTVVEAGVVTAEGAVIVDDVITSDGEFVQATAILPDDEAPESNTSTDTESPAAST